MILLKLTNSNINATMKKKKEKKKQKGKCLLLKYSQKKENDLVVGGVGGVGGKESIHIITVV